MGGVVRSNYDFKSQRKDDSDRCKAASRSRCNQKVSVSNNIYFVSLFSVSWEIDDRLIVENN